MNLFLKLIFGAIIMFAALQTNAKISVEEFYDIKFNSIDGNKISLEDYRDKTFLVVTLHHFAALQDSLQDYKIFGTNTEKMDS